MPVVAIVDGMLIMFFFNDHDPPHFHVDYGDFRAKVSIATLKIIDGELPANKRRRVLKWAAEHQEALSAAWKAVQNSEKPRRIE
ncbi:MAG TPA: DUF4160 domain-containing protein [Xanthobacteraceae bacterium]|nr:DUF4160 domain-containing protein [Xanthobacteraceae bacterium]